MMSNVKPNEEKFSGRVKEYVQYRNRYPMELIAMLEERCGLKREHVIADIGAGTGMLAELFLEHGNSVIAVDPNAEMLAVCEELKTQYSKLTTVMASAETTTLGDASADFVAAGRAFHWFDRDKARVEFKRILKPGGWVALASVGRDGWADTPVAKAYEVLLQGLSAEYRERKERYNLFTETAAFFGDNPTWHELIKSEEAVTLEMLVGQTRSVSFAPLPGEAGFEEMLEALRVFFDRFAVDGVVMMPKACVLLAGQFS